MSLTVSGKELCLVAFDLGASNGRVILGRFDGNSIRMKELHRFDNGYVMEGSMPCWDFKNLLSEVKKGLGIAVEYTGDAVDCFGIDTWGVDYGLLDAQGQLISNPRCYRASLQNDMDHVFATMPFNELYARTGIAAQSFNTLFQLYRRKSDGDEELDKAERMLLMPDLLAYFLTGEMKTEYTIATTTMLYNPSYGNWDHQIISRLGLPSRIFTEIDRPGSLRGRLNEKVAEELGCARIPYAAVGCHDTASAVAAIPGSGDFVFCSSGTWSLFGVENHEITLGETVRDAGFTNEGTVQNGYRLLKSIMGLWLIQECRRIWKKRGLDYSWDDITDLASREAPFRFIIDPDNQRFFNSRDIEEELRAYCRATGQGEISSTGQFARCIFESLALKYRWAFESLESIMGHRFKSLNIVGGGCRNALLNQMVADSVGVPVIAGPEEGAAMGNLLVQAIALGRISGIDELRSVVGNSTTTRTFEPGHTGDWDNAYNRLLEYIEVMK